MMNILALEPYYGGSHRAFLDGWSHHSRHCWNICGLPAHKWKWRMRHSAISFAQQIKAGHTAPKKYDILFCSDMLNLAEFKGLVRSLPPGLPSVVYFHENQLTYPVRQNDERDLHFGLINISTALAADQIWFNSSFHRNSFLGAIDKLLKKMPDHRDLLHSSNIRAKSDIFPQGIDATGIREKTSDASPLILWVARWEYDKNPEMFFAALSALRNSGLQFRVSVIGEQFSQVPEVFEKARIELGDRVVRYGFQPGRSEYEAALAEADIVVSTADHEFFGVGLVEAVASGAFPLMPDRLSYPELFGEAGKGRNENFFYDGSLADLTRRLGELIRRSAEGKLWAGDPLQARRLVEPYFWEELAPRLDDAVEKIGVSRSV